MDAAELAQILAEVAKTANGAGVFESVDVHDARLSCEAKGSAQPAFYRVDLDDGHVWVSLVTLDRWLSESIEATLMVTGDKLEELLDEELVDLGFEFGPVAVQHFRSDDMQFTFRSPMPSDALSAEAISQALLAYEACFAQIGNMSPAEDD